MNNKPTLSNKLKSENKKFHGSLATVMFVVFITVAASLTFIAIKSVFFDKRVSNNSETTQETEKQIEETQTKDSKENEETYTVKSGDTLYLIGINLGLDWQEIAELNEIEEPYTLSTGQELKLPSQQESNNDNNLKEN